MKEKSFSVYGIRMPKIKEVLPTNLPTVQANELRLDNLFLLEDDSILLIDYESECRREDMIDYLNYLCRILKKYFKVWKKLKIRVIILYTSDLKKANSILDIGCLKFQIEQVFLTKLNAEKIKTSLSAKINAGKTLTEKEQMQLIILPLTVRGQEEKQKLLLETVEMARQLNNEEYRTFVLAGILTFSDKIMSDELADSIRREIRMLKVEKIIFEEGLERGLEQGLEQGIERGIEQGDYGRQVKTAVQMIRSGLSNEKISEYTELTEKSVEEIRKGMLIT